MGASPVATSEQSQPFLAPPPPPSGSTYGFPVPIHAPFEDYSPAYLLLPVYPFHRRRRRRCSRCCFLPVLSASSSLIAIFFSILVLSSAILLLWPSDPELSIVRLRLDRFRVAPLPSASIDISMGLEIKIRNPNFFPIDYSSIVASIFYRGERLFPVTSSGGHVAARGVSYVDADLHLDGVRVLEVLIYLIGDLAKGSVPFDTVTEVRGWLRLFLFDVPIKGETSCKVDVNPNDETIIHQDCFLV